MAQMDDEFWFAAPAISRFNASNNYDRPIIFNISSFSDTVVTVTISLPAKPSFTTLTYTVPANGYRQVNMTQYINDIVSTPENTVLNNGILIKASGGKVNISYEVALGKTSTETYSLKGKYALGTEFMFPGQNEYSNHSSASPPNLNRMDIVATEDGTRVTITPKVNIKGHPANTSFDVNLNRGQSYSCIANSYRQSDHFHGTYITANKPIAITQTDDNLDDKLDAYPAKKNGQDLIGDQIIPSEYIGIDYIAIKGSLQNDEEKVYLLAMEDSTAIYARGNPTAITMINRGETYRLGFAGENAIYFTSSKPVYAYQLTGINIEFGSAMLPPIKCTGSNAVKYRRGDDGSDIFKLNIFVQKEGIHSFHYNGSPGTIIDTDFSPVPGTNGKWMYCSKDLTNITAKNELVTIDNFSHKFHMGVFEGGETTGCAYGFYSAFGSNLTLEATINEDGKKHHFCEGDSLLLAVKDRTGISDFNWTGPNNFTVNQSTFSLKELTPADNGTYFITGNAIDMGCEVIRDSVIIEVTPTPIVDLGKDTLLCEGAMTLAIPDKMSHIAWNTGSTDSTITISKSGTHIIIATITDEFGCMNSDTISIDIKPNPIINLGKDTLICEGTMTLAMPEKYSHVLWSDTSTNQTLFVDKSGEYFVTVTDEFGCMNSDTISIDINPKPKVDLGKDTLLCEGAITLAIPDKMSHIAWNTGSTDSTITISKSGTHIIIVTITDEFGCMNSDTISIDIKPNPVINLGNDISTCKPIVLNATGKDLSYLWSDGSTSSSLHITESDTYYLTVTDLNGCIGSDTIQIEFIKYPSIEIENLTANYCTNGMAELVAITDAEQLLWNTDEITPTIIVTSPGLYSVTATNGICSSTASYTIKVCDFKLYFPNAITASNKDLTNDYFCLSNPADVGTIHVAIYNRFGEAVYVTDNPYFKWDGKHKGEIKYPVVYTYIIHATNKQGRAYLYKGSLMVL